LSNGFSYSNYSKQQCKEGEKGELLVVVNKARVYDGYYRDATASQKKVVGDVLRKGDIYFRTGDLVRYQWDGYRKFIMFEDRMGDTFRWKGENVSTMVISSVTRLMLKEVTTAITAFDGIDDASVYGVALPNHDGRAGCAAIILSPSHPPDLSELLRHIRQVLPNYAVPLFLRVTADLRLTGNMKHQKSEFKEEGVDPGKVQERLLWLRDGAYVEFTLVDWENLKTESVRL